MTLRELNSKRKVNFPKTFTEAYKSQTPWLIGGVLESL